MSISTISTGSWDSLDNINDEDVFETAVKKVSTKSEPVPVRELVQEIRRHSAGDEIVMKHFAQCESIVYIGSEKAEKVLVVIDDNMVIAVDPLVDGRALLKSAILNAPKISVQNVYNLEAANLDTFHGKKQVQADNLKMSKWFLDFLEKRKKSVKLDAYYAGLTQFDDIMTHLPAEKSLNVRRLSDPIYCRINSNSTVSGVSYVVRASRFVIPRKHSITLDVTNVLDFHHTIIRNNPMPPETREVVYIMGGHPMTFLGLPPFQLYFKLNLDRLLLCFDFVTNLNDTPSLTKKAITIVSRLLLFIRLARPGANVKKLLTVLMFFMWENDDPEIDEDEIKYAVTTSPEVIQEISQLQQSLGPTCVIAVDFGCLGGTKTPTELISIELPRNK